MSKRDACSTVNASPMLRLLPYASHNPPYPGDDPLQPHGVRAAVCALGRIDGLGYSSTGRAAELVLLGLSAFAEFIFSKSTCSFFSRPLERSCRHSSVPGRGPQCGNGV